MENEITAFNRVSMTPKVESHFTPEFISMTNQHEILREEPPQGIEEARLQMLEEMRRKVNFFHPGMSRHIAECVLLENGQVGSYLFRTSTASNREALKLALSVRCFQSVKHYEISWNGDKFNFGMGSFATVDELLDHFSNFPVIGGDSGVLTMLKHPYPRSVDEGSIYDEIKVHAEWKSTEDNETLDGSSLASPGSLSIASKEGYLTKIGKLHKNWKLRWFVCLKMQLSYYDHKGDSKPIRKIDLNAASKCEMERNGKQHCFSLVTANRTYLFVANSDAEAKDWITLLKWKITHNKTNTHTP